MTGSVIWGNATTAQQAIQISTVSSSGSHRGRDMFPNQHNHQNDIVNSRVPGDDIVNSFGLGYVSGTCTPESVNTILDFGTVFLGFGELV